jgi:hypothetical protein
MREREKKVVRERWVPRMSMRRTAGWTWLWASWEEEEEDGDMMTGRWPGGGYGGIRLLLLLLWSGTWAGGVAAVEVVRRVRERRLRSLIVLLGCVALGVGWAGVG